MYYFCKIGKVEIKMNMQEHALDLTEYICNPSLKLSEKDLCLL